MIFKPKYEDDKLLAGEAEGGVDWKGWGIGGPSWTLPVSALMPSNPISSLLSLPSALTPFPTSSTPNLRVRVGSRKEWHSVVAKPLLFICAAWGVEPQLVSQ